MIVGGYVINGTQKTKDIQDFNRVLGVYSWGQDIGLDLFFLRVKGECERVRCSSSSHSLTFLTSPTDLQVPSTAPPSSPS